MGSRSAGADSTEKWRHFRGARHCPQDLPDPRRRPCRGVRRHRTVLQSDATPVGHRLSEPYGVRALGQFGLNSVSIEPAAGHLIEIQPTSDLHRPTVIQAHLTIVQLVANPCFQSYVVLQQAILASFCIRLSGGLLRRAGCRAPPILQSCRNAQPCRARSLGCGRPHGSSPADAR